MLAGIGAIAISKEKVEDAVEDFVRQGKIKAEDARIMADRIVERGKRDFEDMAQTLSEKIQEYTTRSDRETKEVIAELEARIRILETRLAELSNRSNKP